MSRATTIDPLDAIVFRQSAATADAKRLYHDFLWGKATPDESALEAAMKILGISHTQAGIDRQAIAHYRDVQKQDYPDSHIQAIHAQSHELIKAHKTAQAEHDALVKESENRLGQLKTRMNDSIADGNTVYKARDTARLKLEEMRSQHPGLFA